jgi:hypothetical protein
MTAIKTHAIDIELFLPLASTCHHPGLHMTNIPVIDLNGLASRDPAALSRMTAEVAHACREVGFFYVRGHGVPGDVLDAVMAQAHAFFAKPQAYKDALKISADSDNQGYVGLRTEALDPGHNVDDKEALNILIDGRNRERSPLCPDIPGFDAVMADYFGRMLKLGADLHRPIARDLGLAEDYFDQRLDRPMATLRLLHYPPASVRADGAFGAGAHTDYGNLTLLMTDDAGGLEVQRRDGDWIAAPPIPGAFICNIGDCLMRWTNDVYRSTPHRVTNPKGRDRYSLAFFFDANADALVEAIPSCVRAGERPLHAPITAGDYLASRFAQTYGFTQVAKP